MGNEYTKNFGGGIFPDGKYRCIYADPPWPERGGGKIKRGADRHYKLISVNDIKALPVLMKDNIRKLFPDLPMSAAMPGRGKR